MNETLIPSPFFTVAAKLMCLEDLLIELVLNIQTPCPYFLRI